MNDTPRAIFITGAARGIGLALTRKAVAEGWMVGLADINAAQLAEACAQMRSDNCLALPLDVRDRGQWNRALADFAQFSRGRLDMLVNNAGIVRYGWIDEFSEDDIDQVFAINVQGVIHGVRAGLELLKATPGSTLVNVASIAALRGNPKYAIYSASKFAVRGLTQSLDLELARYGIRTVCIMPWSIETPLLDGAAGGGAMTMRESMVRQGQTIYTADYAADAIWAGVQGDAGEVIIGDEGAEFIRRAKAEPERLRAALKKAVAAGSFD